MSEKHLTELPWKTLTIKKHIKDGELGKALASYGTTDGRDPAAQLKALDKILTSAETIKRGCKDDKEVSSYLDEILKEARKNKATVAVATKAPPADKDNDEDAVDAEAEEYKKEFKSKLVSAMAQVKARAPQPGEEPKAQLRFVALVSGKMGSVLVAANAGGAARKVLKSLAGDTNGAFVTGECLYEKNAHTFVVQTVPGGLAKKLSRALSAQTGQSYKVRVRTPDGSVVLDGETDVDPDAADEAGAPGANAAAPDPAADRWKGLKAELYPGIKAALETYPSNRAEILQLVGEASRQEKEGNFAAAVEAFQKLEAILQEKRAKAGASPAAPEGAAATDEKAVFTERLRSIQPELLKAIASNTPQGNALKLRVSEAGALARQQDFAGALRLLGEIESSLGGGSTNPPGVRFQVSILDWDKAKNQVQVDLSKLEKAIVEEFADEPKIGAIKSGLKKLGQVLGGFDERLRDKLDEAYSAPRADLLPPLQADALGIVDEYLNYVETDGFIDAIDNNPFIPVSISGPLTSTLQEIAKQLRAQA